MKKFLGQSALFLGLFCLIHLMLLILVVVALRSISLELPVDKHTLLLGQSHIECALDDSIVPDAVNMALSGEVGIVQVEKLEAYLDRNPHIDTVVMPLFGHYEAAPGSRRSYLEYYIGFGYIEQMIKFGTAEDWKYLWRIPMTYKLLLKMPFQDIGLVVKLLSGKPMILESFHFGGFNKLERNGLQQDIEKQSEKELQRSFFVPEYLLEARRICVEKNVNLILMQTPVFEQHRFFDVAGFERFKQDSLKGFTIADYSDFRLPAEAFGDVTHLNREGARLFSIYLAVHGIASIDY